MRELCLVGVGRSLLKWVTGGGIEAAAPTLRAPEAQDEVHISKTASSPPQPGRVAPPALPNQNATRIATQVSSAVGNLHVLGRPLGAGSVTVAATPRNPAPVDLDELRSRLRARNCSGSEFFDILETQGDPRTFLTNLFGTQIELITNKGQQPGAILHWDVISKHRADRERGDPVGYGIGDADYYFNIGTPNHHLMTILKVMRDIPDLASKKIYDVGCGSGTMLLAFHYLFGSRCAGVDYEPRCCEVASKAVNDWGLDKTIAIQKADAGTVNYSDGDVFYFFAPCSGPPMQAILERLYEAASQKPITVVWAGPDGSELRRAGWLRNVDHEYGLGGPGQNQTSIFVSRLATIGGS